MNIDIIIQGETTLLSQKITSCGELDNYGDISVSWSLPSENTPRPGTSCLYFCEFVTQIFFPLIRAGQFEVAAVEKLAQKVSERVEQISSLYEHVYLFDFVACINWTTKGYADATSTLGQYQFIRLANDKLAEQFTHSTQITVLPQAFFWNDHVPKVSKEYFARTSCILQLADINRFISQIIDFVDCQSTTRIKCVCIDLDDTIWGGIASEVSDPRELELGGISGDGRGFQILQYVLKELKLSGIYLAVISKNTRDAVERVFHGLDEMILSSSDIHQFELGYSDKASRIVRVAERLNILLESVLFIDDNPTERGLIKRGLPDVNVLDLPSSPAKYADALSSFKQVRAGFLTDEDYGRCGNANVTHFEVAAASGLMDVTSVVDIAPADSADLPRILQLINKTNQFNSTGTRMSQSELAASFRSESDFILCARVRDEFADMGLVGIVLGDVHKDITTISAIILSCRAFGREVEHRLMEEVINHLPEGNVVKVKFADTGRNQRARDFILSLPMLDERLYVDSFAST